MDLAKLKTAPGEYTLAFYGSAVAKYRYNPDAITAAKSERQLAQQTLDELKQQTQGENARALADRIKQAEAALAKTEQRLAAAEKAAAPKDIVDIYVTEPIRIRVLPAEESDK